MKHAFKKQKLKELRKEDERQFFDREYKTEVRKGQAKFYSVVNISRIAYKEFLLSNCRGKNVLELASGGGYYSRFAAKQGARMVVGIDLSEEAVKKAQATARQEGLSNVTFLADDAEKLQFAPNSFDVVCAMGILHHIKMEKLLKKLVEILKPEGTACFIEPLGYNPLIKLYRKLTPHKRTKCEHPLKKRDLVNIESYFYQADFRYYFLFSPLAVLFRNARIFSPLVEALHGFDRKLFGWVPGLKFMAWEVMMIIEGPRKDIQSGKDSAWSLDSDGKHGPGRNTEIKKGR